MFINDRLNVSLKGHDLFLQNRGGNLLYNAPMELYQMNLDYKSLFILAKKCHHGHRGIAGSLMSVRERVGAG